MGKVFFELPAIKCGTGGADGKNWIKFLHESLMEKHLHHIPDGTNLSVKVSKLGKPKSNKQLGYYRAAILPAVHAELLAQGWTTTITRHDKTFEIPITRDHAHELLKSICTTVKSCADMKIDDASEFIDNCIVWASMNLGMSIDPPRKD